MTMTSQFADMTSSSDFFEDVLFFLSSLVTGQRFMSISSWFWSYNNFFKGLTRNPEIGNTPTWVLLNIWRLGRGRDTRVGTNVSNEMFLNVAKCQGYSFYRFWVIKGKWTGGGVGGVKFTPRPPSKSIF